MAVLIPTPRFCDMAAPRAIPSARLCSASPDTITKARGLMELKCREQQCWIETVNNSTDLITALHVHIGFSNAR